MQTNNLLKNGFKLVCPPVDCVGYDKNFKHEFSRTSQISFLLLRDKILIELLQKGSNEEIATGEKYV